MDITTIAFLVLLGGSPAEHVIAMPTMDDCHRAGETVTQYQCLNADQFDDHIRDVSTAQSDFQVASGGTDSSSAPTVVPNAMEGVPSALKRRANKALYPEPNAHPNYPAGRTAPRVVLARIVAENQNR